MKLTKPGEVRQEEGSKQPEGPTTSDAQPVASNGGQDNAGRQGLEASPNVPSAPPERPHLFWIHEAVRAARTFLSRFRTDDLNPFEGVLTLVSIVGLGFLIDQGYQLRRSNEHAALTLRTQSRAWVGPRKFDHPGLKVGARVAPVVTVANSGATPALNTQVQAAIRFQERGSPFTPEYKTPGPHTRGVIHPGATIDITPETVGPVTEEDLAEVKGGRMVYRFYGVVLYDDVFGCRHRTSFCYHMDHQRVRECDGHNDVDIGDCHTANH